MRKTKIFGLSVILSVALATPVLASANYNKPYKYESGNPTDRMCRVSQRDRRDAPRSGGNQSATSTTPTTVASVPVLVPPTRPTTTPPVITPPVITPSNEQRFTAYLTGYGWPDNTPAGGDISHPVIHSSAGGTGTFADPITLAVGHSITSGKDTLDYAAGTKFYIPALRRYFIVEDSCGDGSSPQNGPCHTGHNGKVWLDAWVGGTTGTKGGTLACEDAITGDHVAIQNPKSTYLVVPGPVFSGSCSAQYGDVVVTL